MSYIGHELWGVVETGSGWARGGKAGESGVGVKKGRRSGGEGVRVGALRGEGWG